MTLVTFNASCLSSTCRSCVRTSRRHWGRWRRPTAPRCRPSASSRYARRKPTCAWSRWRPETSPCPLTASSYRYGCVDGGWLMQYNLSHSDVWSLVPPLVCHLRTFVEQNNFHFSYTNVMKDQIAIGQRITELSALELCVKLTTGYNYTVVTFSNKSPVAQ